MSANVNFYSASVFQADHTVLDWSWGLGDNQSYWGFSVRPAGANNSVELQRVVTVTGNSLSQTTVLTVSVQDPPPWSSPRESGGGLLHFAAIGSS